MNTCIYSFTSLVVGVGVLLCLPVDIVFICFICYNCCVAIDASERDWFGLIVFILPVNNFVLGFQNCKMIFASVTTANAMLRQPC